MDASVVGARLASSVVAPMVRKLFVTDGPGAGLVERPVRVSGLVSFRGEKRKLNDKDLRKIAAELVQRAVQAAGPGERPVPPGDEEPVAEALARTLRALGELRLSDVEAVEFGYRRLAEELLRAADRPDRDLSYAATQLYTNLLDTACLHIVHFFTQRSAFVARTLVAQSQQLAVLTAKVDALAARSRSMTAEDTEFERRYARHVAEKHGTLTIYGIDLANSPGQWPLDTAYLSLEADVTENSRPTPIQAEHALAGRDRVLLRGVAGSGKTTLVQWLAVTAAEQDPAALEAGGGALAVLYGRVPFVMPMRSLTRQDVPLPTPETFLSAVRSPLAGAQPHGWADRVLSAGRGILLVDGIDEVPEKIRERARQWLRDLIGVYPDNLWLVTSRPSAIRIRWLSSDRFTELSLAPMNHRDVTSFIKRWHAAARLEEPEQNQELIDSYEGSLITAVRTKHDLARLATNPLMCGLICALHRDRRGYLPHARKELYDAALSMLLSRRDRERDMHPTDDISLSEEPQTRLLQRLAYKFLLNGRSELDRSHAERIIAQTLPAVPSAAAQGDASAVFRHLLLRSGLLREPAPGSIDFIHRTFQDYLGAKAAVEEGDFSLLVLRATDTQWEDVIRMAVAHCRPRECAELLRGLLHEGDITNVNARRAQLHLLAMACLEHAVELEPVLREEIERRAKALIPPRSAGQARDLAATGAVVLELLPAPELLNAEERRFTVHTAVLIGGDAAIPVLARFRDHDDPAVAEVLVRAWRRFDTLRYAEEVLAHLALDRVHLEISTDQELRAVRTIGGKPRIRVSGRFPTGELVNALPAGPLTHLWLPADQSVTWYWLASFPGLRSLALDLVAEPVDLSSLAAHPALREIRIDPAQATTGFTALPPELRVCTL